MTRGTGTTSSWGRAPFSEISPLASIAARMAAGKPVIRTTETDAAGQDREVAIPFMKGYTVFNVDQIEGLNPGAS